MSQEKTLYLHIGLPKTGTTSIQNYLFENREALMQRGVCYPKPLASVGHHAEALLFLREKHPETIFHWHRQATEAADNNCGKLSQLVRMFDSDLSQMATENRSLILSSEGIFEAFQTADDIAIFPLFFPDYTIKVIFYIRRIDKMVSSAIMEHIKVHEPISEEVIEKNKVFREKQQLQILERLQYWEGAIGRENVIMRPFEKEQLKDNDAVADFMSIIDPSYKFNDKAIGEQNLAISLECAHFMAQTLTYPAWKRTAMEATIGAVIVSSKKLRQISHYKGSLLSPQVRRELLEKLNPTYQELAKRYLDNKGGNLFVGPLPNLEEEWESFSGLTYQNAKPIYEEVITTLYQRLEKLQKIQQENIQLAKLQNELNESRKTLALMCESWSWKLSWPLRMTRLFFVNNKGFWRLLRRTLTKK